MSASTIAQLFVGMLGWHSWSTIYQGWENILDDPEVLLGVGCHQSQ